MRGVPREQYERTYILLPPKADAAWAQAVVEATWDTRRRTLGGSADDGGVGNLDVRRVVIVNAQGWGGERVMREWYTKWYPGVELTFVYADTPEQLRRVLSLPEPMPASRPALLVGLHDEAGGRWMASQGMQGICLVHEVVQDKARALDYRYLQQKGIVVICRLNWGYADGTGTMPPPEKLNGHLMALAITMQGAYGVDYFHPWNEPNNASEWPRGSALTANYVVGAYNRLCGMIDEEVKIGPPPLDPFYGPGSDNGEWWRYMLERIARADALFLHTAKTQFNDPALITSEARFQDEPLRWQYLNARATETYLGMVPGRWRHLPVFATECNPQRRTNEALGWHSDNGVWVHDMCDFLRSQGIAGAVFYRYERAGDQAPFGLEDQANILSAIRSEVM